MEKCSTLTEWMRLVSNENACLVDNLWIELPRNLDKKEVQSDSLQSSQPLLDSGHERLLFLMRDPSSPKHGNNTKRLSFLGVANASSFGSSSSHPELCYWPCSSPCWQTKAFLQ